MKDIPVFMNDRFRYNEHNCQTQCRHCTERVEPPTDAPAGRALVFSAMLVFWLPQIMALAGTVAAGSPRWRQWFGAWIGLAAGFVIAVAVQRLFTREKAEQS